MTTSPRLMTARAGGSRLIALVSCLSLLLAACSAGGASTGGGPMEWRDLDLVVPSGWTVLDQRVDLLLLASEDIRLDDADFDNPPELQVNPNSNDVVAVQLTTDATSTADEWRALIAAEGGTLEIDERIEVGSLPATALTFRWVTNNVDTRERVVLVPSRQLLILLQPVPVMGQSNAPDVYDAHVEELDALLASIVFGRPLDS